MCLWHNILNTDSPKKYYWHFTYSTLITVLTLLANKVAANYT